MTGRSIKIFLIHGTSSGLRTAEIGLSTIKALVIPRASIFDAIKRAESQKTGVYILIGTDPNQPGQKMIYIGEGDTIINRLKAHNKDESKDFWEEAVLFVSKDENLTKSHVRYLEARLIALANESKRAIVTNGTAPSGQRKIPEADEVDMDEFIIQARLLLGALGYDLFEPSIILNSVTAKEIESDEVKNESYPKFKYFGAGFSAECIVDVNAGKYIVKVDSLAKKQEAAALPQSTKKLREQLITNGVLVEDDTHLSLRFSQDYSFSSLSSAAQVVAGFSVSGPKVWKNGTKTYAEWQDSQMLQEFVAPDHLPYKSPVNSAFELGRQIITMEQSEVILEVGAEGGSIAILRERNSRGDWQFLNERDESTLYDMLSEEDQNGIIACERSGYVSSFDEALKLFDCYPWFSLYPVKVHPDFLDRVLLEVLKRGGESESTRWRNELKYQA